MNNGKAEVDLVKASTMDAKQRQNHLSFAGGATHQIAITEWQW